MSTIAIPDRFTALPDESALNATVVALEEHGFSVEVAGDLDAARRAVLVRIPEGSSGAVNVIFVARTQKLVPTLAAVHERVYTYSRTARPDPLRPHPPARRPPNPRAGPAGPQTPGGVP